MNLSVTEKEEPKVSVLEFDDVAKITLVARVTGINEYKDEDGTPYKSINMEFTITDVDREQVSLRGALERGLNKISQDVVPHIG